VTFVAWKYWSRRSAYFEEIAGTTNTLGRNVSSCSSDADSDRYGILACSANGIVATAQLLNADPITTSTLSLISLKLATDWSGLLRSSRTVSSSRCPSTPPAALTSSAASSTAFLWSRPSGS
jgi:hypothetical protein